MQSLSRDLRSRFIDAIAAGASARAAGRRFDIAPTPAIRWAKVWREHGRAQAKPRGRQPGQGAKLLEHAGFLLGLLDEQADITLHEVRVRLAEVRGVSATVSTIWRFYRLRGISRKKDRACRRAAALKGRSAALGMVRAADRA